MMPHDLPPYTTVYGYFRRWQRQGHWQQMHDTLARQYKRGVYGDDGGKKVKGGKRHIVVDSQELLIGSLVSEANTSERLGAVIVFDQAKEKLSKLEVVWVDQGYSGENFATAVQQVCGETVRVEVIKRTSKTFESLPKRWIVERTLAGSIAFVD